MLMPLMDNKSTYKSNFDMDLYSSRKEFNGDLETEERKKFKKKKKNETRLLIKTLIGS